jgi:hypothetical protein
MTPPGPCDVPFISLARPLPPSYARGHEHADRIG